MSGQTSTRSRTMRLHHVLLLGTITLAPGTALAAPAYTITNLGTLGGPTSIGTSINTRRQVTGYSDTVGGSSHAFLWDPVTGMQDLGTLGETPGISNGNGINTSGQVTGYSTIAGGFDRAFLWDAVTGMQDLGTLGGPSSIGN